MKIVMLSLNAAIAREESSFFDLWQQGHEQMRTEVVRKIVHLRKKTLSPYEPFEIVQGGADIGEMDQSITMTSSKEYIISLSGTEALFSPMDHVNKVRPDLASSEIVCEDEIREEGSVSATEASTDYTYDDYEELAEELKVVGNDDGSSDDFVSNEPVDAKASLEELGEPFDDVPSEEGETSPKETNLEETISASYGELDLPIGVTPSRELSPLLSSGEPLFSSHGLTSTIRPESADCLMLESACEDDIGYGGSVSATEASTDYSDNDFEELVEESEIADNVDGSSVLKMIHETVENLSEEVVVGADASSSHTLKSAALFAWRDGCKQDMITALPEADDLDTSDFESSLPQMKCEEIVDASSSLAPIKSSNDFLSSHKEHSIAEDSSTSPPSKLLPNTSSSANSFYSAMEQSPSSLDAYRSLEPSFGSTPEEDFSLNEVGIQGIDCNEEEIPGSAATAAMSSFSGQKMESNLRSLKNELRTATQHLSVGGQRSLSNSFTSTSDKAALEDVPHDGFHATMDVAYTGVDRSVEGKELDDIVMQMEPFRGASGGGDGSVMEDFKSAAEAEDAEDVEDMSASHSIDTSEEETLTSSQISILPIVAEGDSRILFLAKVDDGSEASSIVGGSSSEGTRIVSLSPREKENIRSLSDGSASPPSFSTSSEENLGKVLLANQCLPDMTSETSNEPSVDRSIPFLSVKSRDDESCSLKRSCEDVSSTPNQLRIPKEIHAPYSELLKSLNSSSRLHFNDSQSITFTSRCIPMEEVHLYLSEMEAHRRKEEKLVKDEAFFLWASGLSSYFGEGDNWACVEHMFDDESHKLKQAYDVTRLPQFFSDRVDNGIMIRSADFPLSDSLLRDAIVLRLLEIEIALEHKDLLAVQITNVPIKSLESSLCDAFDFLLSSLVESAPMKSSSFDSYKNLDCQTEDGEEFLPQPPRRITFPSLRHLVVTNTEVTRFGSSLNQFQCLVTLDLSHNVIGALVDSIDLPNLMRLDLSHNRIVSLDFLQKLKALRFLDASHNLLSSLKASVNVLLPLKYTLFSLDLVGNKVLL